MSERQPIETAPRDGTPILVFGEGNVVSVSWHHHIERWLDTARGVSIPFTPTEWAPLE
ncbi:hypothetical protein [Chryseobacterium sp.]|uniref:hypothetical protein n=1 Tax=Chryseobacterium sp. TaxID=1871047 RepID=UPI00321A62CC